jgi:hypothetical protein
MEVDLGTKILTEEGTIKILDIPEKWADVTFCRRVRLTFWAFSSGDAKILRNQNIASWEGLLPSELSW